MTVYFSILLEIIVSSCSLAFACISAFWLYLLYRFRATAIIKAHSYFFLSLSIVGSLLAGLSVFSWPLDSPAVLCSLRPWAFTLPLYLLLCPLLAKSYRMHRIFNISSLAASKFGVSDLHVGLISLSLILPQLLINAVWTATHPLQQEAITMPSGSVIHDCHATTASAAFAWASVAYLACLLCLSVYLTLRLRHLASEFNQSKDIMSCALLIVGAAAVIIALQVTSDTDYNYRYSIRSFGLLLILLTWQLVTLLPKFRAIYLAAGEAGALSPQGIAHLPISPHSMKHMAGLHPPPLSRPRLPAKGDTPNPISPFASRLKPAYPALSPLTTFMAPDAPTPQAGQASEAGVELTPTGASSDTNNLNRVSISATQTPAASASGDGAMGSGVGGKGGRPQGHMRSKSQAMAGGVKAVRGEDRLPSLKAIRAGAGGGEEGGIGGGRGTVRGGKGRVGGEHVAAFKTNFEDHVSPLYTPAAITVEQVPLFLQIE